MRFLPRLAAVFTALTFLIAPAHAMKIQTVKSPGGIEAWLVEEHSVPIIAINFAFKGGTAQDPADIPGVANFLTTILDEGAGELKAAAFQEKVEELGVKIRFDAGRDRFFGSFESLSATRDEALALLKLALTKPRFDADAIERMRAQHLSSLAFAERDPSKVAERAWFKLAFGDHPYAHPVEGTKESLAKIDAAALEGYRKRVFARDTLKISVVGDIDAKTLGAVLDDVFGSLAAKADLKPVPDVAEPNGPKQSVIEMDVPQSVAQFGHGGILRQDPDFIKAYVLNYIIGGGGFNSRLMEEVREKRGLAYSIWSHFYPLEKVGLYFGSVATKNAAIYQSLDVVKAELKRMAESGPSKNELDSAKSYLTGSYPLRFDTSSKIAGQLLAMQTDELGIDYVERRNSLIEAVTVEDIKRVAKRLIKPENLIVTIVGRPKAAEPPAPAKPAAAPGRG